MSERLKLDVEKPDVGRHVLETGLDEFAYQGS